MKKRFTLMMMVLCFLMSIPLKMMAVSVTVHFIDKNGWTGYDAYVYDINTNQPISKDYAWPGKHTDYTISTVNSNKVVTWTIDLGTCSLANARIIFNNGSGGQGNQYPGPNLEGFEVANNQYYNNDGKTTDPSEGGSTPVEWNTVTTNRLTEKPRVYSQGFYLAGNFFSFSGNEVTYDDAVFKFQQKKDQTIRAVAETAYDVYMVEIPASLTAHAQVMYVDETGTAVKVFGPTSACGISETYPTTEAKSTNWEILNGTEEFKENNNYWDFSTRNKPSIGYSDGLYEVYIAVDKTTHEPAKWMITHQAKKRVAYFISDAPDATAMPLYDTYKKDDEQFANKFFATVNLAANRSYYVISNYIHNNSTVNDAKDYGAFDPNQHAIPSPTTNKLFLQGNGGLDFTGNYPDNLICPNLAPLKVGKVNWGIQIVEYNPSRGKTDKHGTPFGFCGDLILRNDRAVLTSVSLVGDAIPGTTAAGSWNYKSNIADMVYDDTEQCYKATVVTTVADDGQSKFRFVGNRDPKITWYENTMNDVKEMAKHPHNSTDPNVVGHTADANDPNQVNYTEKGENPGEDWNIIGTVLLVAGLYVFTSILPVMVIILRLIIITPLLQIGIWSYTM